MRDVLLILASVVLTQVNFCLNKLYQKKNGAGNFAVAMFTVVSSPCTILYFLLFNGFSAELTPFSLACAVGANLCGFLYSLLGFRIMQYGRYSDYMTYLMVGGMALPFFAGILFWDESLSVFRAVGLVLLTVCTVLLGKGEKGFKPACSLTRYRILLGAVFLLNGGVSVITKFHQTASGFEKVSTDSYAILSVAAGFTCSLCLLFLSGIQAKRKASAPNAPEAETAPGEKQRFRAVWLLLAVLSAGIGAVCSLCQLIGAETIDASMMYPMMTGGMLVLSALAGHFLFGEKLTVKRAVLIGICFLSTLLFVV